MPRAMSWTVLLTSPCRRSTALTRSLLCAWLVCGSTQDEQKRRAEEGEARESSLTPQNGLSAYSCGCIRSVALKYFLA